MGRKARDIAGTVSDVCEVLPHKDQFRIRFKLNGEWNETTRAKKEDAELVRAELFARIVTQDSGMRATYSNLLPDQVRSAQYAFQILANAGLAANPKAIIDAATLFVAHVQHQAPKVTVGEAFKLFYAGQEEKRLSKATLTGYRYFFKPFLAKFGERIVSDITPMELKEYIFAMPEGTRRFNAYGALNAFFLFCGGKHNPHVNGVKWVTNHPLTFQKPGYSMKEVSSLTFEEIKALLKAGAAEGQLGYYVFRLFSMMRGAEAARFTKLGGGSYADNRFINLETNRLTILAEVAKDRSTVKAKPRAVTIHPTFAAWIKHFAKEGVSFNCSRLPDERARKAALGEKVNKKNMLRHTAVTMP